MKRAKNMTKIVPYPSLEPSGNKSGLSITIFMSRMQAKENIKPNSPINIVEINLFFTDSRFRLIDDLNSASNIE
tara:strand:+ start:317 stop:538 length:222 start_codon:yes stop_codon:yes gene_type:complete